MANENYEGCDVQAYLERIGFKGTPKVDVDTLYELQRRHVQSVPYENIDIMAGKELTLDIPSTFDKIVRRRRGGYCFELNGLFGWLLRQLGFNVIEHYGRWLRGEPIKYPTRRHRVIRVKLDGVQYICDVGVGMTAPREPLVLKFDEVQTCVDEKYQIIRDEVNIYVVQYMSREGSFKDLYSFNDDPCIPIDFYYPHYYCTTHPHSPFKNFTMVYIRTECGRNVITDAVDPLTGLNLRELRLYKNNECETKTIRSEEQFKAYLEEYFGILLDAK